MSCRLLKHNRIIGTRGDAIPDHTAKEPLFQAYSRLRLVKSNEDKSYPPLPGVTFSSRGFLYLRDDVCPLGTLVLPSLLTNTELWYLSLLRYDPCSASCRDDSET